MKQIKVNVWKLGYDNEEDFKEQNENIVCVEAGYVIIDETEDWEEECWHYLNWSMWSDDEKGIPIQPENVHSPVCICNHDIVLSIEGSNIYRYAKPVGWGTANSLQDALLGCIAHIWSLEDCLTE